MTRRSSFKNIVVVIIIMVVILLIVWPFIYIFISSFKPLKEIMSHAAFFPRNPTLKNYRTLLFARTPVRDFPRFLLNSLYVSVVTVLFTLIISSISGYGIARSRKLRRGLISKLLLFIYVFPTVVLLVPIYKLFISFGWYDNMFGLVVTYTALVSPFCTWLLVSFFENIPKELEESAGIDGAGVFTTFVRIVIPLASPGLVTAGAYSFITAWGEYMFALILISSNLKKTGPLGLATFTAEQYIEWGPLLAGSILIMIPVFLLFMPVSG
ncbi:MAG: carbohydrate ABC transporter permease, partial [Candidatus Atribacteria bacterium]|nr:carbohydrate ABC transporter permease [Candidatus Atribacteria bacterium]